MSGCALCPWQLCDSDGFRGSDDAHRQTEHLRVVEANVVPHRDFDGLRVTDLKGANIRVASLFGEGWEDREHVLLLLLPRV
jgi:hypothetical protein